MYLDTFSIGISGFTIKINLMLAQCYNYYTIVITGLETNTSEMLATNFPYFENDILRFHICPRIVHLNPFEFW